MLGPEDYYRNQKRGSSTLLAFEPLLCSEQSWIFELGQRILWGPIFAEFRLLLRSCRPARIHSTDRGLKFGPLLNQKRSRV